MLALTSASVRNQNQSDLIPALPVAASLPLSHSSTSASCLLLCLLPHSWILVGECPYITVLLKCPHPQSPPQLLTGNGPGERLAETLARLTETLDFLMTVPTVPSGVRAQPLGK